MNHDEIYTQTIRHFLGPIQCLLNDPTVEEVMIVGPRRVYAERKGRIEKTEIRFKDTAALLAAARNIAEYVGRPLGPEHHSMDGRLPDGSRVHAIIPPASRQEVCLTIRRFKKCSLKLEDLVGTGSLAEESAEFLRAAVRDHVNIVISGGAGTGKTTLLNALSAEIPEAELELEQEHAVYLEAQPPTVDGRGEITIRDLFVDSLRMRPDRIVVGEVRRGEALDLVQSMISGHAGTLTTLHANTPRDAASRLETLCLQSDAELPLHVARVQVASAIQLVVQLTRQADGLRKVTEIALCRGLSDEGRYLWERKY